MDALSPASSPCWENQQPPSLRFRDLKGRGDKVESWVGIWRTGFLRLLLPAGRDREPWIPQEVAGVIQELDLARCLKQPPGHRQAEVEAHPIVGQGENSQEPFLSLSLAL